MKINNFDINENFIEQSAIDTLQLLGWNYSFGKTIVPEGENPWRERVSEVVLRPILTQAVRRLNPQLPESAVEEVVRLVTSWDSADLLEQNKQAYGWLRNGVAVSYQAEGEQKHDVAILVDFAQPEKNDFRVVNQLDIATQKGKRIPDLIGFVNGLPLVVFELKNPLAVDADLPKAYAQLQTYKSELPDLFVFNQALVISDGTFAKLGALTADFDRFTPWRVVNEKAESELITFGDELKDLLRGLFKPKTWLDYVQNFVIFEKDSQNRTIKKIGAYHQFYGVNEAVDCTLVAASERGNRKIGVVWHTQGSGKSLSMLFYAGKVLAQSELRNPTLVMVTDRNDLDGQLFATFSAGQALIKQTPVQADSREELRDELAKRESGGVIFTTIQKFGLLEGESAFPMLNERSNIIVIADEAHRSQYGFEQKLTEKGEYRTGYAQHLRQALPNASFIGFTGTPLMDLEDRDTRDVFGSYVSIYDFQRAIEDGATVPIFYEPRQAVLRESPEFANVVREAEAVYGDNQAAMRLREEIQGLDSRLDLLAQDIVSHYEKRTELVDGKAMIVVMSRKICVKLYQKITALRPSWHSDEVTQGAIKVVMTSNVASDPPEWRMHQQDKKTLEKRFKDPDDPLKIVIVRDMWLTGFDVPCCNTMYLDKPMQDHNLMQAIARVNRVFRNKSRESGGLIVDYYGLTEEMKAGFAKYTNAGGKGEIVQDVEAAFGKMLDYIETIRGQFATPVEGKRFDLAESLQIQEPQALLAAIRRAANHILALDRMQPSLQTKSPTPRKDAFLQAVRLAHKGFSLCAALPKADKYRQELAFFDAVRRTISKSEERSPQDKTDKGLQLAALLNRAVESEGVVDLFEALEKDRPNINLLSDEFLASIKQSETKDLWVSALERYLGSQIRQKSGANQTLKKDFEQKLKEAMSQYHNHNLSVIDILEELIALAQEFDEKQKRGESLGLSPAELAFYDALAQNASAKEQMGDETLMKLAKMITNSLRKSVTIDWQYKDSVRAKMRLLVRRALLLFKYPPDKQEDAIEYVMQQAEAVAEELATSG
ncbi:restriction endonuclease subunit R [Pasteurellaceae bacterium RH1A]|nr:restriction endonuclease subunit R [Pasteurellaceae bacterium RH1A]